MELAFYLSSPALSGGAKVLVRHARLLAARGHETTVVAPRGLPWCDHPTLPEVPERARLLVATRYRDVPLLARDGRPVVHLIQGDDGAGPRAVLARSWNPLARLRARRKLARVEEALALPTRRVVVARHLAERFGGALAPNGVDLARFQARGPRERIVLIAGPRSVPTKRIDLAFAAATGHGARVVHLAPGDHHPGAEAARLDDAGVERLLARTTVYVSAVSQDEGFDLVALEAMAAGVACVLSGGGAHREVAPGLVVPEEGLRDAVRTALDDPAPRVALGLDAARARDWSALAPVIEAAYLGCR